MAKDTTPTEAEVVVEETTVVEPTPVVEETAVTEETTTVPAQIYSGVQINRNY